MLGIDDPIVWLAYALCMLSTVICVLYAWRNWDRGDDTVHEEDIQWQAEEENVEKNL